MKFTLFLLSAAAMVNAASSQVAVDPRTNFGVVSSAVGAVGLGVAGKYAILSKAGISTTDSSDITGSIAVSPIAATAITGFSLTADSTNVFSISGLVTGQVKAANYAVPTPADLTTAVSNMEAAYTDAAGRDLTGIPATNLNIGGGVLGGVGVIGGHSNQLTAGVYKFGSSVYINNDLYLQGSATDIFIFQISGDLIQAATTQVLLAGSNVKPENIFWQVAGFVNIGASAHMEGVLLVKTHAIFNSSSSLKGRILAQTAVTLDANTITQPS
jgi:hypothetical protein